MNARQDYKTVKQAAQLLDVTVGRVHQLLLSGQLKGWKVNGKAWLIHRSEIDRRKKELTASR